MCVSESNNRKNTATNESSLPFDLKMMGKRGGAPGLFEFLEEADLPQYYHSLRNVLRVYHVPQLKYVVDDDLYSIGMSRPEARRLKVCFQKYNPQTYTSKLKKLLLPNTWSKDEYLLDDTNEVRHIIS